MASTARPRAVNDVVSVGAQPVSQTVNRLFGADAKGDMVPTALLGTNAASFRNSEYLQRSAARERK